MKPKSTRTQGPPGRRRAEIAPGLGMQLLQGSSALIRNSRACPVKVIRKGLQPLPGDGGKFSPLHRNSSPTACGTVRCLSIAWRVTGSMPARAEADASLSPRATRMLHRVSSPRAASTGTRVLMVKIRHPDRRPAHPAPRPSPRGGSPCSRPDQTGRHSLIPRP